MSPARFVAKQFGVWTKHSELERLAMYEQRLSRGLHAAIRELNLLRKLRDAHEDDESTEAPVLVDVTFAQNKPTKSDAAHAVDSEVATAPETVPSTPTDAPNGTGGHIEQNKPTAGPPTSVGGLGEVLDVPDDPTMPLTVDAPDARPHPPSP
jgi:hypothetical protein